MFKPGKVLKYGQINDMPKGWVRQNIVNKKIYNMWSGMLRRVYDKWDHYEDCVISKDFLLLSNFVKWIEQEPTYNEFCDTCESIRWTIDKDIMVPGNREYTPDKIRLVTNSDNVKEELSRNGNPTKNNPYCVAKAVIGVNIKDYTLKYYKSIKDSSKDGFTPNNVSNCARGVYKSSKGYKWFYTTDLLGVMNYLRGY